MKQHFERNWIYYLIGVVILTGIVVCFEAYRPAVGTELSDNNADWGNFGAFFWGLGTMCFTLCNVIVFYILQQRIYKQQFYDTYRKTLDEVVSAFLMLPNANNVNSYSQVISFSTQLQRSMINMTGILGGISTSSVYNKKVRRYANTLLDKGGTLDNKATYKEFIDYISSLSGFQICLLTDECSDDE